MNHSLDKSQILLNLDFFCVCLSVISFHGEESIHLNDIDVESAIVKCSKPHGLSVVRAKHIQKGSLSDLTRDQET
jgi:hypothetical protein